jgi:hypothetical protein
MNTPTPAALVAFAEQLQCCSAATLVAALAPGVDLAGLVRRELSYRGLDGGGAWVGFQAAEALLNGPAVARSSSCVIDTRRYFRSHMKEPRGRGLWIFETLAGRFVLSHSGTYAEAKKAAIAYGKANGHAALCTAP